MLARRIARSILLTHRTKRSFGGGHGHGEDYHVSVDQNATWIKYKSDPSLAAIQGVIDTHHTLRQQTTDDPFEHLRNSPFFSFNYLVFTNDPWYHDQAHQIYNSAPERGYVNGQDPLQSRYLYINTYLVCLVLGAIPLVLYGMSDLKFANTETFVWNDKQARDYVIDQLQKKNEILNKLKAKEAELLASAQ